MRGFTLVEVLVALTLVALLAVSVQVLTLRCQRTCTRLTERVQARDARRAALDLIAQDVSALPVAGSLSLGKDGLRLATLSALQTPRMAARHAVDVRYQLVADPNGSALIRNEREPASRDWPEGVELASGLAAATFELFAGRSWHTSWPLAAPQAAKALRVQLAWADGTAENLLLPLAPLAWNER